MFLNFEPHFISHQSSAFEHVLDTLLQRLGRLRWLRTGIRYRIINRLGRHHGEFTTDYFGYSYWGQLSSSIDWFVYYFGGYSLEEMDLLGAVIGSQKDWVALDVGANNGVHSLFLSTKCRRVHAFEPFPPVLEKLNRRIAQNAIKNIDVHPVGLGERDEALPFYASTNANEGIGTFAVACRTAKDKSPYGDLMIRSGDAYLKGMGVDRVDLVKIDAEGMELSILKGLSSTIEKYRPILFFELSETTRKCFDSAEALLAALPKGYEARRCIFSRPRFVLIETTKFQTCNYDFLEGDHMLLLLPALMTTSPVDAQIHPDE